MAQLVTQPTYEVLLVCTTWQCQHEYALPAWHIGCTSNLGRLHSPPLVPHTCGVEHIDAIVSTQNALGQRGEVQTLQHTSSVAQYRLNSLCTKN